MIIKFKVKTYAPHYVLTPEQEEKFKSGFISSTVWIHPSELGGKLEDYEWVEREVEISDDTFKAMLKKVSEVDNPEDNS